MPPVDEISTYELDDLYFDLLRRNREFLKALKIAGISAEEPELLLFRQLERPLIDNIVSLVRGDTEPGEMPGLARAALETAEQLAAVRLQILDGLEPAKRDRALAAEPRVRVPELMVHHEIATVEFAVAEERGEIVEIEMPVEKPDQRSQPISRHAGRLPAMDLLDGPQSAARDHRRRAATRHLSPSGGTSQVPKRQSPSGGLP